MMIKKKQGVKRIEHFYQRFDPHGLYLSDG